VTRELGNKISSTRDVRRSISCTLKAGCAVAIVCAMPTAYAGTARTDIEPGPSPSTTHSEQAQQGDAGAPLPVTPVAAVPLPLVAVPLEEAVEQLLPDYSKLTHHQLTKIGARWGQLGDTERRGLLNEVKLRMARQKGSEGTLQIRTQRRYGRLVRRSDGKVLRIETKVIQVAPVRRNPTERSFGVGFERRHAEPEQTPAGSSAPSGELADGEPASGAAARRINNNNR
jgi:hypothetical protein